MDLSVCAVLFLLVSWERSYSQVLAYYDFLTDTTNSAHVAGITVTTFHGGPGLTAATQIATDGQPAGCWYGQNWSTSNDIAAVRASDLYAWLRVTVDSGMTMSLTDISLDVRPHGSGPRSLLIDVLQVGGPPGGTLFGSAFSHSDQTQTGAGDSPSSPGGVYTRKTWETVTRSSGSFTNLTGTYEIRFFGYDAPQADREALVDNIIIQGTVAPIPEPSGFLPGVLGMLFFLVRRSR